MKFLVVRFSAIGDCVMAAHATTAIRLAHHDALLAWAVESRCAPVVAQPNLVDLRYEFPRDLWGRRRWSPGTWWSVLRTYAGLRRYRFDAGIDLQGHSKTALCLYLARPKKRLAAHATDSLARRLNPLAEGDPASMHVVEWYRHVLAQVGKFPNVDRPIMPPIPNSKLQTPNFISIATGAGARDKQWPIENWQAVGDELARSGFRITYLGGRSDPHPLPGSGEDLVGKLTLEETMGEVARSAIHLAGDTGTGHIAAAYGIPVVSVFGPTEPERYRPWTERGVVLRRGRETSNIFVEEVIEAACDLSKAWQ